MRKIKQKYNQHVHTLGYTGTQISHTVLITFFPEGEASE